MWNVNEKMQLLQNFFVMQNYQHGDLWSVSVVSVYFVHRDGLQQSQ
jgi:hypothetical protein